MIKLFSRPFFVAAHVDDAELFAGGTLAKYATHARVLAFSRHKGIYHSPITEFSEAMGVLSVEDSYAIDWPACDGSFESMRGEIYKRIRKIVEAARPSVVITHPSNDTNQDHRQVFEEVVRVCKGKVPILCGCFPENEVPGFPVARPLFVRLTHIDVSLKLQALSKYKSQHKPHRCYFSEDYWIQQHRVWGSMIEEEFAEPFEVVQLWD